MASNSKMEIKKFNGKSFELWKICWWIEISGSRYIQVLHLQEIEKITGKIWIRRQRA
jgi:hypothetical protein